MKRCRLMAAANTKSEVPTFDQARIGAASAAPSSPVCARLTRMMVTALVLCVSAPDSAPMTAPNTGWEAARDTQCCMRRPVIWPMVTRRFFTPMKNRPNPASRERTASMVIGSRGNRSPLP